MPQAALQLDRHCVDLPATSVGQLPAWITNDPQYHHRPMRAEHRRLLQEIADLSDPTPNGSLVGALGGQHLADRCGCSYRAFWRRLGRLQALGYVVVVCRGGMRHKQCVANTYGIPGECGALDHLRATQQQMRMAPDGNGRWTPQITHPGDQPTLWQNPTTQPKSVTGVHEKCHGGSDTLPKKTESVTGGADTFGEKCHTTREKTGKTGKNQSGARRDASHRSGPSKNDSQKHSKTHSSRVRLSKPRITDVKPADLQDTGRLLVLYDQAVLKGWAMPNEHGKVQFVAKAVYAQRKHRDKERGPGPLFIAMLKAPLYDSVTGTDEDQATHRLADHYHGVTTRAKRGGVGDWKEEVFG